MTIETSPSIENLAAALGRFQAETHGVVKDAANPFFKSRYATLEAVIETARPGLAKAGLAFLQAPRGQVGMTVELETMLMHGASGEWLRFATVMPLPKADPQGVGSAITYACRYALMASLGLPAVDDDAEATRHQPSSQSRAIYVENSIQRIADFESAAELLAWAKTERARVWPQYGLDAHDPDGLRIVNVYKDRMAVLESQSETA
jgi:hypothetical protein